MSNAEKENTLKMINEMPADIRAAFCAGLAFGPLLQKTDKQPEPKPAEQ